MYSNVRSKLRICVSLFAARARRGGAARAMKTAAPPNVALRRKSARDPPCTRSKASRNAPSWSMSSMVGSVVMISPVCCSKWLRQPALGSQRAHDLGLGHRDIGLLGRRQTTDDVADPRRVPRLDGHDPSGAKDVCLGEVGSLADIGRDAGLLHDDGRFPKVAGSA